MYVCVYVCIYVCTYIYLFIYLFSSFSGTNFDSSEYDWSLNF